MSAVNVEKVQDVFSTQETRKIGTGTTTKCIVQKKFWFVETLADGKIECQPLSNSFVPSGPKKTITMEEFVGKFIPEPECYMNSVSPKMMQVQQNIDSEDTHSAEDENFTAKHENNTTLQIDDNLRANFDIGLTYMQRGESNKALNIFMHLLNLKDAYTPEHKHLFSEFGTHLRKIKMYNEAVEYYERALTLSPNDENIHINLARVLLEKKDFAKCTESLLNSLALAPEHKKARKFLKWLLNKKLVPAAFYTNSKKALESISAPVEASATEQPKVLSEISEKITNNTLTAWEKLNVKISLSQI